jgi:hypothetical protein
MKIFLLVALIWTVLVEAHAASAPSVEGKGAFVSLAPQDVPGSRTLLRKTAILSIGVVPRKTVAGDPLDVVVVIVTSEAREGSGSQYRFSFVDEAGASKFVDELLKAIDR